MTCLSIGAAFLAGATFPERQDAQETPAPSTAADQEAVSQELAEMYRTDQDDRKDFLALDPAAIHEMMERDKQRLGRVEEIVAAGTLATGDDYYHAAMILQHGDSPGHYLQSHVLATAAGFEGHRSGKWLAAASLDRFLQKIDRKQVFGTQYFKSGDTWTMEPYDTELLPDAVRAAYGVPSLEEGRARLKQIGDR